MNRWLRSFVDPSTEGDSKFDEQFQGNCSPTLANDFLLACGIQPIRGI